MTVAAGLLLVGLGAGAAMANGTAVDEPTTLPEVENGTQAVPDLWEHSDTEEDEAEGPDRRISGPDLTRASQVALDYVGEGRVTGTEIGDEESYYEIEVTLEDRTQIDVQLDESFEVVGTD